LCALKEKKLFFHWLASTFGKPKLLDNLRLSVDLDFQLT
jgi:hypothetical protein